MILNNIFFLCVSGLAMLGNSHFVDEKLNAIDQGMKTDDDYYEERAVRYKNHIYKEGISTPVVHRKNLDISWPIMELGQGEPLDFYFDDLNETQGDYYYTIIHCDHQWNPSDLMESEYLEGYTGNPINDFQTSFNTFVQYTNYHVQVPNEDVQLTKSGNYILLVYENSDMELAVITYRFVVYENLANVELKVNRPTNVDEMNYRQEVSFTVDHGQHYITDPFDEIHVSVLQNNRWDNAIHGLKPQFIQNNKLVYSNLDDCSFEGGSEFRYLDLKSRKFKGEKINQIEMIDGQYNFFMKPEQNRAYLQYLSSRDINGKFIVKDEDDVNSHTDADYMKVHITLKANEPFGDGDVYLYGGLSLWEINERLRMTYEKEKKAYTLTVDLKQGYYNYLYAIPASNGKMNTIDIEGTHFETENDYNIIVYQTVYSEGYDRVIALGRGNSRKP